MPFVPLTTGLAVPLFFEMIPSKNIFQAPDAAFGKA
jgi:hypothetical protein